MTLKPDCVSKYSFLDAASSALLVATVWHAVISATTATVLTILVNSVFICCQQAAPLALCVSCLPISQSVHAHRTKSTELLNFDVVRSGGLHCGHQRLSCHLRLALLSHASWMARLCCESRIIGVEFLLSPDVDLVLGGGMIPILHLSVVL